MVTQLEIGWIAGILEGEGCFSINNRLPWAPRITVGLYDLDVINKIKNITHCNYLVTSMDKPDHINTRTKLYYYITIPTDKAIQWMMTIYPLMSKRRQETIKTLLNNWKLHIKGQREYCSKGHALIIENRTKSTKQCKLCMLNYYREKRLIKNRTFKNKTTVELEHLVANYVSPYKQLNGV